MKVDLISENRESTEYILYLQLEDAWSEELENLKSLQDRISGYLAFILNGQMARQFPESRSKRKRIRLACTGISSIRESRFLTDLTGIMKRNDVLFDVYNGFCLLTLEE
jgi:hypothetical protein